MSFWRGVGWGFGLMLGALLAVTLVALVEVGVVAAVVAMLFGGGGDGSEAFDRATYYSWPVESVTPGGMLEVDAGVDLPAELAPPLRVCTRMRDALSGPVRSALEDAREIRFRDVVWVDRNCSCQAVADVFVDG